MVKQKLTEDQLCITFYKQVLQLQAWNQFGFDFLIFHVPNESHTSAGYRIKLSRLGVVSGISDYLIMYHGKVAAIEFKRDSKSRYTDKQIAFKEICKHLSIPYLGTHNIEEAIDFIKSLPSL